MGEPQIAAAVLAGENVRLRPFTDDDVPLLREWYSDPEVLHWLHLSEDAPHLHSLESHRERWERMRDDPTRLTWLIETSDGQPIGEVELIEINKAHGRAELGITIGEKSYWNGGCGTDAVRAVLRFAFGELGLRRVTLITDEDNARCIRCYEKCGFLREGVFRNHRLRNGRPLNMVTMAVLKDEWK
jgi:RimJ/RimL family protein N-acetyltransferase